MLRTGACALPPMLALGAGARSDPARRGLPTVRGSPRSLNPVLLEYPKTPMEKKNKQKPSTKKAPKAATKKAPPTKAPAATPAVSGKRPTMEKPSKKTALRDSILARKAATKPIAFSLDEVRAIAKTVSAKAETTLKSGKVAVKPSSAALQAALEKPVKPNHIKAASLADIL